MKGALVAAVVMSLAVSACGTINQRAPLALDTTVPPEQIDEVVVLPVIDARPFPFEQVRVAQNVEDAMVRYLRERGYVTIAADTYAQRPTGPIDLHVATADQLVPLSPEDASYFVLVQVERLEPGYDDSNTYDARLSAVMVDRPRGRVVWRDVATASSTLGGVLSVFGSGSMPYNAAVNASRALVSTLPDKRPPKKR